MLARRSRLLTFTAACLVLLMALMAVLAQDAGVALGVFAAGGLAGGFLLRPFWGAVLPPAAGVIAAIVDASTADINPGYSIATLLLLWIALSVPGVLCAGIGAWLGRLAIARNAI